MGNLHVVGVGDSANDSGAWYKWYKRKKKENKICTSMTCLWTNPYMSSCKGRPHPATDCVAYLGF